MASTDLSTIAQAANLAPVRALDPKADIDPHMPSISSFILPKANKSLRHYKFKPATLRRFLRYPQSLLSNSPQYISSQISTISPTGNLSMA